MYGALLQGRRSFRRWSSLEAQTVPSGLDRYAVRSSSTHSPRSPSQLGELRVPGPTASPLPCEASPTTTMSPGPSQTPTQPNQSGSPRPPASPLPSEVSRKTTMSQRPATAEYNQVSTSPMPREVSRKTTMSQRPATAEYNQLSTSPLPRVVPRNARMLQRPATTEYNQVFKRAGSEIRRRASTEGRFYSNASNVFSSGVVDPDACQQLSPPSRKRVTAGRIEACRLLHFRFSGEARPLGLKGFHLKVCHRDVDSVKKLLNVLDRLMDQLTWKLINIPSELEKFVKEGRQSSCHYSTEHFVDLTMKDFSGCFRCLPLDTNFPYWEDWAKAASKGSEDEFLSKLCRKIALQMSYGNTTFTRDDVLRLLWPYASSEEIETIRQLCPRRLLRLPPPPVTDPIEYHDLCRVFESMDDKNIGEISFEVVAENGFFDPDQKDKIRQLWDIDGNGLMSKLEFCQMMCTSGFRATGESTIATLFDGRRVLLDPDDGTWYLEEQGRPAGSTKDSLPAAVADQQSSEIPPDHTMVLGG